nr:hypothetical protein CFP56_37283 [Quercus suber]
MARVIFLAGAPKSESLRWDEDSLLQHYQPPVRRFLGDAKNDPPSASSSPSALASFVAPEWRIVPCDSSVDVAIPALLSSPRTWKSFDPDTHIDFVEHSLAILDNEENLAHLPTASHLASLNPQTLTINLLAAVIQSTPLRTVRLRRPPHASKQILELLLGDDTRANFPVTFWFPCVSGAAVGDDEVQRLRVEMLALRPGDLVLMQNIALTHWRGVVYGCSLERRVARSSSKVTRVREEEEMGRELVLPAAVGAKLSRVRKWRDDFVGRKFEMNEETTEEILPVDETQLAQSC